MRSTQDTRSILLELSEGRISAMEARRMLDNATYGDLLRGLALENLPLPRAPKAGRERQLATAREWMFPSHGA